MGYDDKAHYRDTPDNQNRVLNHCDERSNFPRVLAVLQPRPETWTVT